MRKLSFRSTERVSASQKIQKSAASSHPVTFDGDEMGTDEVEENKMLKMMQIGDTQHHFTRNGRLVANKQLIYKIDKKDGIVSVSENINF